MNSIKTILQLISILAATFAVNGCSDEKLQGSCNSVTGSDGSVMCVEYYKSKNISQWQMACGAVMQGSWSEKACDNSEALGGCRLPKSDTIIWLYPSEKYQDINDVERFCQVKNGILQYPS